MKKMALMVLPILFTVGHAEGWERVSRDEITFEGEFDKNSYREFMAIVDGGYREVRVSSLGGNPNITLLIAEDIQRRGARVTVEKYCASACANYILTATRAPRVKCGAVLAWHGTFEGYDETSLRMSGFPETVITQIKDWTTNFSLREKLLLSKSGINPGLLIDSGRFAHDNASGTSTTYGFDELTGDLTTKIETKSWFPTTKVLRNYGIDTRNFCPDYDRQIKTNMERLGIKGVVTDGD